MTAAVTSRAALGLREGGPTSGWRVVNSEGDGLPGLTVDRYGADTVVQIATAAMAARQAEIVPFFAARTTGRVFAVSPAQAAEREGFTPRQQLHGDDATLTFMEHGLRFTVPAPPAQKTGAYLDQRDNRRTIAALAQASGGPLLDVGCHVGGFALHAAALGVPAVGLDQSARALACAQANAADNGLTDRCAWVQGDMFAPLADPALAGPFGVIVFDPPRVASSARDVGRAAGAMTGSLARCCRGSRRALRGRVQLQPHLGGEVLDGVMLDAGAGAWTRVHTLGPGPDHPVWPGHARARTCG
jgi:23S rRNA (cytosine1962-C5)-methyltransferase